MPAWTPRTHKDVHGLEFNPIVQADCCPRQVPADMLIDASMQPMEIRRRGELFHCHVCRERLFMSGRVTREEYFARHNPPEHVLEKMRGIDSALR